MTRMAGSTVPLWHRVSGHGPLLVLIHGITEDHRTFDPLIPSLERNNRVLVLDLRGHGDSPQAESYPLDAMAADVAAVVAEVGARQNGAAGDDAGETGNEPGESSPAGDEAETSSPAGDEAGAAAHGSDVAGAVGTGSTRDAPLVVGHSLGGIVAAAYGARFPVRGVINIDQSLDLAAMQAQVTSVESLLRGDAFPAVIAGMFDQMTGALPQDEQQRLATIRRPVQQVVLGIWAPLLDLSADELTGTVDDLVTARAPYPYLQVQGIDPGPDYPAWLRERIPGARFDPWPGLGHYPHLCQPERFVALLRAFDPAE